MGTKHLKPFLQKQLPSLLKKVQEAVSRDGYTLVIYDAYRPRKAVKDFITWGKNQGEVPMKPLFYPTLERSETFKQGYISPHSAHSRGSTVDLTLIETSRVKDFENRKGCPWKVRTKTPPSRTDLYLSRRRHIGHGRAL
jgi:D-alanyl-D-alanine dipeptidase